MELCLHFSLMVRRTSYVLFDLPRILQTRTIYFQYNTNFFMMNIFTIEYSKNRKNDLIFTYEINIETPQLWIFRGHHNFRHTNSVIRK